MVHESEVRGEMWKERKAYTALGLLLLAATLYLNLYGSGGGGGGVLKIPIPWLQPRMGFVSRNGTQFLVDDDGGGVRYPLYVNGWNSYWLLETIAAGDRAKVSEMLGTGRGMGMGVCRTWAFSDGGGGLQFEAGRFDERVFQVVGFFGFGLGWN